MSEFAIIIAIEALVLGLLLPSVFDAIILAAAITLVTSSFTRYYEERIYRLLSDRGLLGDPRTEIERWSSVPDRLEDHIVIVGYGRHGRRLVELCEERGLAYVVIENSPGYLEAVRADCEAYVFGDVIESDTCEMANISGARLVVSTPDSPPVNEYLMQFTDVTDVIIRTKEISQAKQYLDSGADYVMVTDLLAADRLAPWFVDLLDEDADLTELRDEIRREGVPVPRTPQQLPRSD